jgi:aryl-alcohol dehydrogenase-like predicted oxidoreductase
VKYRRLLKSSVKLSLVGQGTDQFGNPNWGYGRSYNDADIKNIIDVCILNGVNFFDTGELYGYGLSEKILGQCLSEYPRDDYYLISKVPPWNLRFNNVIKTLNASLKRLKTTYIDFLLIHHPNPFIPMKETLRAFEYLKKKGKINHIGVSNFNEFFMQHALNTLKSAEISLNEIEYNLFSRHAEIRILPFCKANNIDVLAYSPFSGGLLTGRYNENNLPSDRSRKFNLYNNQKHFIRNIPLFRVLKMLSDEYNTSLPEIVLSYIQAKDVIPVPGSLTTSEVISNVNSVNTSLSSNDISLIDKYSYVDVLKHNFDHKILRPIGWIYQGFRKQVGLTKYMT